MNKQEDIYQDIIDCIRNEANAVQQEKVKQWVSENEKNEREYKELLRVFTKLSFFDRWNRIETDKAKAILLNQFDKRKRLQIYRSLAVAASITVLVSLSFIFYLNQTTPHDDKFASLESSVSREFRASLTLSSGETVLLSQNTKDSLSDGGTTINYNTNTGVVYSKKAVNHHTTTQEVFNTLKVARGEEYQVVLADGTKVWMNSESELKFPIAFVGKERKVYMKGEAYFDVKPNKDKAFVVQTEHLETRVLGTEFNVSAYPEEDVNVTLVEGSVELDSKEVLAKIKLLPGENANFKRDASEFKISKVDVNKIKAWRDGCLYFEKDRLEDILTKLARWYDIEVFYQNSAVKDYMFRMRADKEAGFIEVLKLLEATGRVNIDINNKTVLVSDVKR